MTDDAVDPDEIICDCCLCGIKTADGWQWVGWQIWCMPCVRILMDLETGKEVTLHAL